MGGKARRRRRWTVAVLLLAGTVGAGMALQLACIDLRALLTARTAPKGQVGHGPEAWAVPIDRPGLPNLHWVSPDLYRGAQRVLGRQYEHVDGAPLLAEPLQDCQSVHLRGGIRARRFETRLIHSEICPEPARLMVGWASG